jgi:hypothetical protein
LEVLAVQVDVQLPEIDVPAPDQDLMAQLTEQGVAITPVAVGSNFLQVNLVGVPETASQLITSLEPLADNIVSLKLSAAKLDDKAVQLLANYPNLVTLVLSRANINDESLKIIAKCQSIVTLNLESTQVTNAGVEQLKDLGKLRQLNLHNTAITDKEKIKELFPKVKIEFGGYDVPVLPTDTVIIKVN